MNKQLCLLKQIQHLKIFFSRISQVHLTAALVSNLYVNLLFILFIQSFIKFRVPTMNKAAGGGAGALEYIVNKTDFFTPN